jgi:hypothetical protein
MQLGKDMHLAERHLATTCGRVEGYPASILGPGTSETLMIMMDEAFGLSEGTQFMTVLTVCFLLLQLDVPGPKRRCCT